MLEKINKIYIVGIKGVAMTGLAILLKKMNKQVIGSDVEEEFPTDKVLKENRIKVVKGFDKQNISSDIDLIIYSAGHQGINNVEVKQGKFMEIPIISQPFIIAQIMKDFERKVAVVGCHGKTTTASFLSHSLIKLKENPSYLTGSPGFNDFLGADFKSKKYFIVEADEYGVNPPVNKMSKFMFLDPDYIIATNIDFDHPDVFQSIKETKKVFYKFFSKLVLNKKKKSRIYYCFDDLNLRSVVKDLPESLVLSYGFSKRADLYIYQVSFDQTHSYFNLIFQGKRLGRFTISLFGRKNISNAVGVILFLLDQGYDLSSIKRSIKGFKGAKRRFELIYHSKTIYLFDDYGHHPEEISATIDAARARFPKKRIIVVFQPHTYSRTQALKKDFSVSLAKADFSLILPIFASARENSDKFNVSSNSLEELAKKQGQNNVLAFKSKDQLLKKLTTIIKAGDVIFTMGAGDVYKLRDDIIYASQKLEL